MAPAFLILLLALIPLALGLPAYELVLLWFLFAPALAQFVPGESFLLSLLILIAVTAVLKRREIRLGIPSPTEVLPFVVFFVCYGVSHMLAVRWPDFHPLGEHMRDISLVTELIAEPFRPQDPWLAGQPLHYYAYGYRIGAMCSRLFGVSPWETYHALVALVISLYASSIFRLLHRHLRWSLAASLLVAFLIAYGPSAGAVIHALRPNFFWFTPSRVIAGAINEFPVWSFILGDVHPHYLALPLIPAAAVIALALPLPAAILSGALFIAVVFTTSAWELPFWLIWFAVLAALALPYRHLRTRLAAVYRQVTDDEQPSLILIPLAAVLLAAFLRTAQYIPSGQVELAWVGGAVLRSLRSEFLLHWGAPLALIAVTLVLRCPGVWQRFAAAGLLLLSLALPMAWGFLGTIIVLLFFLRILPLLRSKRLPEAPELMVEALGFAALLAVLLPEVIFFNDAYGGEHERMNTIFKLYFVGWFPLHLYAFFLLREALPRIFGAFVFYLVLLCGIAASVFFLGRSVVSRQSLNPDRRGLATAAAQYPGSERLIRYLETLPRGVVAEAPGSAWDYTSFLSILSGHRSYLGWKNHLLVIAAATGEADRREQVLAEIYTTERCERKKELLDSERIDYLAYGPLETVRYGPAVPERYGCLRSLFQVDEYRIFGR